MQNFSSSRREFLRMLPAFALLAAPGRLLATVHPALPLPDHPEPRPGVNASRMLKTGELDGDPDVIAVFDHVRTIPHIVDGIRCPCGCAGLPGNYSLLSCYEGEGMARFCDICQAAGRIAYEQHAQGATLAQIRRHIDGALGQ
jgi:hypothetical protein